MNLQVRLASDLFQIEEKLLTFDIAYNFFVYSGYDFIYITNNSVLTKIISFKNFEGFQPLDCNFVKSINDYDSIDKVEKFFKCTPNANKLVLLNNDILVSEFSNLAETPLQNNVCMNLISLRYIPLLRKELLLYFKDFNDILIIGTEDIFKIFLKYIPDIAFSNTDNFPHKDYNSFDLILDFKYSQRLISIYNYEIEITNLSKILEKIFFDKIFNFCKENNVNFKLYKLPIYKNLTCLNHLEKNIIDSKIATNELLLNKIYTKQFSHTVRDYKFITEREYNSSLRYDNSIFYSQTDCITKNCKVSNGYRLTTGNISNSDNDVYVFGQCTIFGMLVPDDETLQSILQNKINNNNLKLNVYNPSGMHGFYLFNLLVTIMNTIFKEGDTIIVIDVFTNLFNDYDKIITDMTPWFNKNKDKNEICFFNYPEHCNYKAYSIMANGIFDDIQILYHRNMHGKENKKSINILDMQNTNIKELFKITNSSVYKFKYSLERIIKDKNCDAIGYFIHTDNCFDSVKVIDKLIQNYQCVYIFIGSEKNYNFNYINKYKKLKEVYCLSDQVKIIPLEHYFVIEQYYYKNDYFISLILKTIVDLLKNILDVKLIISEKNNYIKIYDKLMFEHCKAVNIDFKIIDEDVL